MKIIRSNMNTSRGTTYYRCSLSEIIDSLSDTDANPWIISELSNYGWDAIDFKHNLFGSRIIDGILYICETNGQDISVNGNNIDPETALNEYSLEDLSNYITKADDKIISSKITGYEIQFKDIDTTAIHLIESGISFQDVVQYADELNLI